MSTPEVIPAEALGRLTGADMEAKRRRAAHMREIRKRRIAERAALPRNPDDPDDNAERTLQRKRKAQNGRFIRADRQLRGFFRTPLDEADTEKRTMKPSQMRLAMLTLDLTIRQLSYMFHYGERTIARFLAGDDVIPLGLADYLRLRVANRMRAMAIGTGVQMQTEYDLDDKASKKATAALARLFAQVAAKKSSIADQLGIEEG